MDLRLKRARGASDSDGFLGAEVVQEDPAAQAARLFRRGVREVVVEDPVDVAGGGATSRAALGLLRELGAWGVACRWILAIQHNPRGWSPLCHLPPPVEIVGDDGGVGVAAWRDSYFPCKCIYREGPGFIQIRDRRSGVLERYTVDEPAFVEAIHGLSCGGDPEKVDDTAVEAFVDSGLMVPIGDGLWWAPVRVRRWPIPAMIV